MKKKLPEFTAWYGDREVIVNPNESVVAENGRFITVEVRPIGETLDDPKPYFVPHTQLQCSNANREQLQALYTRKALEGKKGKTAKACSRRLLKKAFSRS